jgi:hypothetical protein
LVVLLLVLCGGLGVIESVCLNRFIAFLTHVLGSPLRGESNLSLGENPKHG